MPASPDRHADRSFYDHFTDEKPRLSDTDLVGHVNNVGHTAIVETGRVGYIMELAERAGLGFGNLMFVRLELDFLDDLWWPSPVQVGARVIGVGNSSFRVATGTFDGDRCVAKAVNVMVFVGEDRKSARVPDAFRAVMEAEMRAD